MKIKCTTITKHPINGGEVPALKVVEFDVENVKKNGFDEFVKGHKGYIKGDLSKLYKEITGESARNEKSTREDKLPRNRKQDNTED